MEIRKKLEARERCFVEEKPDKQPPKKNDTSTIEALVTQLKAEGFAIDRHHIETFLTGAATGPVPSQNICPFCEGNHYADQCQSVTGIAKRKNILKKKRRCFKCCKPNHVSRNCPAKQSKCFKCKGGGHHPSVCDKEPAPREESKEGESKVEDAEETVSTPAVTTKSRILLPTAQLAVRALKKSRVASCKTLLDSCSTRTHITRSLVKRIRASTIKREPHQINGFGGVKHPAAMYDVVCVTIKKANGETSLKIQALVVDKICTPLPGGYVKKHIDSFPHIRGLELADEHTGDEAQEVGLLIGQDFYYDIINGEPVKCKGAPTIVSSIFGFVVSGDVGQVSGTDDTTVLMADYLSNDDLMAQIREFFEVEGAGVEEDDDSEEVENFSLNIEKRADRYFVNYPRKPFHQPLCDDNYAQSDTRLRSGCKRMIRDDELKEGYYEIMKRQEAEGIIEDAPGNGEPFNTYYMPHHAVIRKDKSTSKIRVVYDASSKGKGPSLNDTLETGTCEFTDLLSVLIRFRCYKVGLSADIEQAFLQIGVKEEDRDLTRFLWVPDNQRSSNFQPRRMRFTRVTFGIVSSMAILDHVNQHHLNLVEERFPDTVKMLRNSLYIDDCNGGAETTSDGLKVYEETKEIYKEAGMNMRKWKSNDTSLMKMIEERENKGNVRSDVSTPSYASATLNPSELAPTKVLGIPWDTCTDELIYSLNALKDYPTGRICKRTLLSATTKPFDPQGLLALLITTLKVLFQNVCKDKEDWDDMLQPKHQAVWDRFLAEAKEFEGIRVPRRYGDVMSGEVWLVGFGDASKCAYAACVYIRCVNEDGSVTTTMVASKTRVAKVKEETTPRLELRAALTLSRLMTKTIKALGRVIRIVKIVCATDAEIVLYQIQGEGKTYKKFVQNQVVKIRKKVPIEHWVHVPGKQNPADLPSRGCYLSQLKNESTVQFYVHGPEWLKDDVKSWPVRRNIKLTLEQQELAEENLSDTRIESLATTVKTAFSLRGAIDFERFESLEKLLRVVTWCRRFIHNWRSKRAKKAISGELTAEECDQAKFIVIRSMQEEMVLESGYKKRAETLGVYEEENTNILRCRGRIGKSNVSFDTKFPILLPRSHYVTQLFIRHAHEKVYHNGVTETLAELRSTYWIVKGRQAVKHVVKKCFLCRKLEGLAYPSPVTCDLPEFRVGANRAFETAGVDYLGPVYLKDMYKKDDGTMRKAYIAITTCATTRMVHFEVAPDLTTAAYVRAQKRFIGRKGCPSMMVSDNGKCFKGRELKRFNSANGIKWRFNLSRAPWWGGMFERMIRSTKRCLVKAIGLEKLTYEELTTVLADVENVINNRPLVYVGEEDLTQPLTPSHLFCGRRTMDDNSGVTPAVKDDVTPEVKDVTAKKVVSRAKMIKLSVDHFWKRWSREYLVSLRETHKMKTKSKNVIIKPGDAVLIHEDGLKRSRWVMGVVEETISGKDGVIRGARVRKFSDEGRRQLIERPLQKLYPLEISRDSDSIEKADDALSDGAVNDRVFNDDASPHVSATDEAAAIDLATTRSDLTERSRPRRKAAVAGVERRRLADHINSSESDHE